MCNPTVTNPEIAKKREGETRNQVGFRGDVFDISAQRFLPNEAMPEAVISGIAPMSGAVVVRDGVRSYWLRVNVLRREHAAAMIGEGGHRRRRIRNQRDCVVLDRKRINEIIA